MLRVPVETQNGTCDRQWFVKIANGTQAIDELSRRRQNGTQAVKRAEPTLRTKRIDCPQPSAHKTPTGSKRKVAKKRTIEYSRSRSLVISEEHRSRGETPWKAHGADELKTSHMISGMARTNKSSYTNSRTLKIPGANGGCRRRGPARIAARLKRPYVKLPFPEPLTEVPRGSDMALRRLVAQPSRAPRRPRLRSKCARPPGSRAPRPLLRAPPHPG